MADAAAPDHYETLQLSPRADRDTVERVFRLLAKRYHPDNPESGDTTRFTQLLEAYRTLTDPERRARYDAQYERSRATQWRIFDQTSALDDVEADRRIRGAILSLLYTARRNDTERPGLGVAVLEQLLNCPEEHMKFHLWYLRELGLLQRLENGQLAITVAGVEKVVESGGPAPGAIHLVDNGAPAAEPWPRNAARTGAG